MGQHNPTDNQSTINILHSFTDICFSKHYEPCAFSYNMNFKSCSGV